MKKYIITISMLLCLATSVSAFAPLVYIGYVVGTELAPYVAATAAIHGAAIVAGVYYYMKPEPSTVSSSGVVSKPSEVQWIDLTLPLPAVVTKPVQTQITPEQLKDIGSKKNPDGTNKYPSLQPVVAPVETPTYPTTNPVGMVVKAADGNNYIVGSLLYASGGSGSGGNCSGWIGAITTYSGTPAIDLLIDGRCSFYRYTFTTALPTLPNNSVPKTDAQIGSGIASSGSSGPVKSNLQSELDKVLQDDDYVPTFIEDNGNTYVPPVNAATPQQVKAYNDAGSAASDAAGHAATASAAASATPSSSSASTATSAAQAAGVSSTVSLNQSNVAPSPASIAAADAAAASAAAAAESARLANDRYNQLVREQAVTTAQTTVTAASTAVTNAQTEYDRLKSIRDGLVTQLAGDPTNQTLKDAVDRANRNLGTAGNALGVANTSLSSAQSSLAATQAAQGADEANKNKTSLLDTSAPGAYGDGTVHDFGARFSTFMNATKSSGLFSLPQQLLGNIPSGGSSSFTVSFGRFGTTVFDLASFGTAISLIRSIVLIIISYSCFRIVLFKGGSG